MKHLGDITKIDWESVETVDVVCGGSPCQDLSLAGKRAGLAGARSGLYMEQVKCLKELRKNDRIRRPDVPIWAIRPRYMVWENVPGAFSSNGGKDFAAVLEEAIRIAEPEAPNVPVPEKGWAKSGCLYDELGGWSVAWRVHDAQFWGVPQRRKRICLVCDFGGLSAPEILFERKGLRGDYEKSGEEGEEFANHSENCSSETIRDAEITSCSEFRFTIGADTYNGSTTGDVVGTITTANHSSGSAQKVITVEGNGSRPSHKGDGYAESNVSYTLNTTEVHGVAYAVENHPADSRVKISGDVVQSLTSWMGTGGGNVPMCLDVGFFTTLENKAPKAMARQYKDPPVVNTSVVRRLTPLECERLQGFPDGWTDIRDWVDSNGKAHKAADSPRYKALGNSIALPFWFYILRRISAQYERPATLGSLFDGIGGFPLCWERCNGIGTARWASEIEEFPMAVTKIRFRED